jgi:conjugal transfer pilus assembly protein TraD
MFQEKRYEIPWRTVYEARASVVWGIAIVLIFIIGLVGKLPVAPSAWMISICMVFMMVRFWQSYKLWNKKFALSGKGVSLIDPDKMLQITQAEMDPGGMRFVRLGRGFEWRVEHQQRLYDLMNYDLHDFMPPHWFMKMRGAVIEQQAETDIGAAWIHGVSETESPVEVPLSHMEGQTLVLGTTGAGKTRGAETIVSQAIWRKEVVIVIDPKFDKDLCDRMYEECVRSGRESDFKFFHPAFPSHSVRIDPMANFGKVTELASRIAALMPGGAEAESFKAFAWRACNIIAQGLVEIYQQPNLSKLRQYVEGGAETLLERVLLHHFREVEPEWESAIGIWISKAESKSIEAYSKHSSKELTAYVHYYESVLLTANKRSEVADGLISAYKHNREHYGKMIASLLPILDMLTSGPLGKLLSPDVDSLDDHREILNSSTVIKSGAVLYIALDSLPDKTVGSAIGSILLADLAAVAGAIYNYERKPRVVNLLVDEASEVVNEPFLSILNKARGAGFRVTVFTQTLPDFISAMGSEEKALQMLGNLNNMIALRTKDDQTQKYITATFGTGYVATRSFRLGTASSSQASLSSFSGSEAVGLESSLEERVPSAILGMLPNFQYFASVSGGKVIKGRFELFPLISEEKKFTHRLLGR